MDPRPLGLADRLLDHVHEGGDVVVGDPFALGHRLDEGGVDHGGVVAAERGGVGRDVAHLDPPLGGQQLHPQPHGEPGLVGEQGGHLRRGVSGDHRAASAFSVGTGAVGGSATAARAMSVRYCMPGQEMSATAA